MAIKIRTNLMLLLSLVGPIIGPTAVRLTLLVSLTNLIYAQDDKQQKDRQKEEISRWIAELGQGQPGDNNQATTALIGMGTEAIPYLLKVFESNPQLFRDQTLLNDHWIRLRAAHCLSQLNYTSIINILMREIERDPHPTMRHIYAIYLTRHDLEKSIRVLVENLKRAEFTIPDIITTLKNINNPFAISMLKPLLKADQSRVRLAAAEILVFLGDASGAEILLSQREDPDLQLTAALLLPLEYKDTILPVLKRSLTHTDPQVRLKVVEKLTDLGESGDMQPKDKFSLLLEALERESDAWKRGSDLFLNEIPLPADGIIEMIGHPDGYDPHGTAELRHTVIQKWRERLEREEVEWLEGLKPRREITGYQKATIGNIDISHQQIDMSNYFCLTGRKAYLIGAMDGSFPPAGRLLGDEGGLWAPPIKLLDGFSLTIAETGSSPWDLQGCRNYQHQFSDNKLLFERSDIVANRQDFVLEDKPGLFSRLTIRNLQNETRTITVHLQSQINIRPAWRSGLPNDIDIIQYRQGQVRAEDRSRSEERLVFGATILPTEHRIEGNRVTLSYSLQLPANGKVSISFLFLKLAAGKENEFSTLLGQEDELIQQKRRTYQSIAFEGVQFDCSDPQVAKAFVLAKLNLHMLRLDLRPHLSASVFLAGYPNYARVFGCDSFYSISGADAIGFSDTAGGTLETLAAARENPHGTPAGPIPHEIATSNRLIGIGNAQEPSQFVLACWQHYRWTGNRRFLERIYPICQKSISFLLSQRDVDKDGYVEGNGLIEAPGAGGKTLEAACYLYSAYRGLAEMSADLGQSDMASQYEEQASDLKYKFNRQWWDKKNQMWATGLETDGSQHMKGFWSVVFPMETQLTTPGRAKLALNRIRKEWVNAWGGVHTWEEDVSRQGSGVITTNIFGLVGFQYGQSQFGWEMVKCAAMAPEQDRMPGAFVEMIPPGGSNFIQLWSVGPFLDMLVRGLGGVEPNANQHSILLSPVLPSDLTHFRFERLQVGEHVFSFSHYLQDDGIETSITHHSGSVPLNVKFCVKGRNISSISIDSTSVPTETSEHSTFGYIQSMVKMTVPVGQTKRIRVPRD